MPPELDSDGEEVQVKVEVEIPKKRPGRPPKQKQQTKHRRSPGGNDEASPPRKEAKTTIEGETEVEHEGTGGGEEVGKEISLEIEKTLIRRPHAGKASRKSTIDDDAYPPRKPKSKPKGRGRSTSTSGISGDSGIPPGVDSNIKVEPESDADADGGGIEVEPGVPKKRVGRPPKAKAKLQSKRPRSPGSNDDASPPRKQLKKSKRGRSTSSSEANEKFPARALKKLKQGRPAKRRPGRPRRIERGESVVRDDTPSSQDEIRDRVNEMDALQRSKNRHREEVKESTAQKEQMLWNDQQETVDRERDEMLENARAEPLGSSEQVVEREESLARDDEPDVKREEEGEEEGEGVGGNGLAKVGRKRKSGHHGWTKRKVRAQDKVRRSTNGEGDDTELGGVQANTGVKRGPGRPPGSGKKSKGRPKKQEMDGAADAENNKGDDEEMEDDAEDDQEVKESRWKFADRPAKPRESRPMPRRQEELVVDDWRDETPDNSEVPSSQSSAPPPPPMPQNVYTVVLFDTTEGTFPQLFVKSTHTTLADANNRVATLYREYRKDNPDDDEEDFKRSRRGGAIRYEIHGGDKSIDVEVKVVTTVLEVGSGVEAKDVQRWVEDDGVEGSTSSEEGDGVGEEMDGEGVEEGGGVEDGEVVAEDVGEDQTGSVDNAGKEQIKSQEEEAREWDVKDERMQDAMGEMDEMA